MMNLIIAAAVFVFCGIGVVVFGAGVVFVVVVCVVGGGGVVVVVGGGGGVVVVVGGGVVVLFVIVAVGVADCNKSSNHCSATKFLLVLLLLI